VTSAWRDATAIVGIGESAFYKRGQSHPQTSYELAGQAILAAVADAGLTLDDVDGITYYGYGGGLDSAVLAQMLGIPHLRWSVCVSGGGGGSAGAVGTAAAAVLAKAASVVVTISVSQHVGRRTTASFATPPNPGSHWDFVNSAGLVAPGQLYAMLARRHMYLYGTTREHFGAVAISSRDNASRMPTAIRRDPITMDDYLSSRMISDPFCLLDYCQETDGAAACVTTSVDRARDLPHPPALIRAAAQGGEGIWGQGEEWLQMPDDYFAAAGYRALAADLYVAGGVGPAEIDVLELYDHFTGMVLLQLEDLGFCRLGESGPFALAGGIRYPDGDLPVNTHGGSHSHVNLNGMNHVLEGVRQMRGQAVNQVRDAETVLITGGPGKIPMSALILRRA
jgi:acetyl-CoA acetyltransferase